MEVESGKLEPGPLHPVQPPEVGDARPFEAVLREQASTPNKRKGTRTRLRLLAATAALLQERFVHALRVTDIAARAEVSAGTFYIYFPDRNGAVEAMLTAFARHVFERMEAAVPTEPGLAASVRATTLAYVQCFSCNAGLFRALMQMTDESARFECIYRDLNAHWNRRTATAIGQWRGTPNPPTDADLLTAYALGGMVDEFLANLYVRRDPTLVARTDSPSDAADVLVDIWLRAVQTG